jgi:hypothetical protein
MITLTMEWKIAARRSSMTVSINDPRRVTEPMLRDG